MKQRIDLKCNIIRSIKYEPQKVTKYIIQRNAGEFREIMQLLTLTLRKAAYNLYEQHSAQLDLTFYSGKLNGGTEK
jgi:hypothetical protein